MNESNTPKGEAGIGSAESEIPKVGKTDCPFETFLPDTDREMRTSQNREIQKAVLHSSLKTVAKLLPAKLAGENETENQENTEEESLDWIIEPDSEVSEVEMIIDSEADNPVIDTQHWENDESSSSRIGEDNIQVAESEVGQDWVAEPDKNKQAVVNSEFQQMLALNNKLRSANDDLYAQVEELKSTLADTQKSLEKQKKRSSVAETMLQQQDRELVAVQEKTKLLFNQLESSTKNIQRQESLIESYKSHLENSQQRLAKLERECTRLHSQSNEQSHKLLESENTCRELRTRLMRQQRQTLQFKAALEKCLDTSVPGDNANDDFSGNSSSYASSQSSAYTEKLRSILKNAQPIKPWSADTDCFSENTKESDDFDREALLSSDGNKVTDDKDFKNKVNFDDYFTETELSEENNLNHNLGLNTELEDAFDPDTILVTEKDSDEDLSFVQSANLDELEEQLDRTIRMFFAPENEDTTSVSAVPEYGKNERQNPPVWEAFATTVDEKSDNPEDTSLGSANQLSENSDVCEQEENLMGENSILENLTDENLILEDSPSPVIYPNRPSKGRKSFASVELPNFPKKEETNDQKSEGKKKKPQKKEKDK